MKFLIVKHILLVSNVGNVQGTVWRICTLMLGCKGLIQAERNKKRNENKTKTKINKLNKKSGDSYTIRKNIFFKSVWVWSLFSSRY